jgi:hypothetical protein
VKVRRIFDMLRTPLLVLCAVALCSLFVGGCTHIGTTTGGEASAVLGPWSAYESTVNYADQHGTVVYHVTYQPNAVVFDEKATENALKGISGDGVTYALDASSPATQLKPGSVLFLYGIAIRKVISVQTQGSNILVATSDADINDLIKDGHISWKVPIDFSVVASPQKVTAANTSLLNLIATPAEAAESESEFSFEGNVGPVDYELGFTPHFSPPNPRLDLNLKYKYSKWGGLWFAEGNGYIEHLYAEGDFDIRNGVVQTFLCAFDGLHSHMVFNWTAETNAPPPISLIDQSLKVKVPYANVQFPLVLRGIPLVVEISAAVLFKPTFTGSKEVTRGKFTVDFDGTLGFSYETGASEPESSISSETQTIDPGTTIFGARAFAFLAALEAPRVEFALASILPSSWNKLGSERLIRKGLSATLQGNAAPFLPVGGPAKLLHLIEDIALPVQPYVYFDTVFATGTFTNGAMSSVLVGMPPCQRSRITVTANGGVGVKLSLFRHVESKVIKSLLKPFGHEVTFEGVEAAGKLWGPKTLYSWGDGPKCPGD